MQENRLKDMAATVLTEINASIRPANEIINTFTRTHHALGSKDRRYLTDVIWRMLRQKARINHCFPNASIREQIDLSEQTLPLPDNTPPHVLWEVPAWLISHIDKPEQELPALLEIPPIVLRANGNRDKIQKQLIQEGIETVPTCLSPYGLILTKRTNLVASRCYKNGQVEIQDEGSQLAALKTNIKPGDTVLDYCAGAGGKSLIFAQMMQNTGKILAHDISERSLKELTKRAMRAGVTIIETHSNLPAWHKAHPHAKWSHVVVDAPCSGTGTWRRCPDARWKLTEQQLTDLCQKQKQILEKAAAFVAPNGYLIYMTCSLTTDENIGQVRSFLKRQPAFKLCSHKQFSPAQTQTDGLFCAVMQKSRE